VKKFFDGDIATSGSDLNSFTLYSNGNFEGSEIVSTARGACKDDPKLLHIGAIVDVFGKIIVDGIVFHSDVCRDARFKFDYVIFQLSYCLLHLN
jgi:hypothetical protein